MIPARAELLERRPLTRMQARVDELGAELILVCLSGREDKELAKVLSR